MQQFASEFHGAEKRDGESWPEQGITIRYVPENMTDTTSTDLEKKLTMSSIGSVGTYWQGVRSGGRSQIPHILTTPHASPIHHGT